MKINFLKFDKTTLNLKDLVGKTITQPKIQEDSSLRLFLCSSGYNFDTSFLTTKFTPIYLRKNLKNYLENKVIKNDHNCSVLNKDIVIELNRRVGMPLYIPILALIASFLLKSKKENGMNNYYTYIYFFIGFVVLILAEMFVRYSGMAHYKFLYYLFPVLSMPVIYLVLLKDFKYENI